MPWYPWDLWSYATVCGDVPSTPFRNTFDVDSQQLQEHKTNQEQFHVFTRRKQNHSYFSY